MIRCHETLKFLKKNIENASWVCLKDYLLNSIFVDAMVSDNNDKLEQKIDNFDKKITELLTQNDKRDGISK